MTEDTNSASAEAPGKAGGVNATAQSRNEASGVGSSPDRAGMGKDGKPDHFRDAEEMVSPDRAEELARKIHAEVGKSMVSHDCDPEIEAVASLLREAEGRSSAKEERRGK